MGNVGGRLSLLLFVAVVFIGCGDDRDGSSRNGGNGGSGNGGSTSSGGTSGAAACAEYSAITDALAACEVLGGDCPENLNAFLESLPNPDASDQFEVFEMEGLRELKTLDSYAGSNSYVFADDGALVGFRRSLGETTWGPCDLFVYALGPLPSADDRDPASVHHCDLATNAVQTGELCDCPCPEPAPTNGVHDDLACVTIGAATPCAPTFAEQRNEASARSAPMRSGCGVRTITISAHGCSYDESGRLVGEERLRGDDPRDECPGVDAYRSGDVPATCDDETVCYFGVTIPEGTPCPWEG